MLHMQHIYGIIMLLKNQVLGDIEMRRLIMLALLSSLAVSYTLPVVAIQNSNADISTKTASSVKVKKEKKKDKKVQPSQSKYEYINLEWWESFNDPILEGYIIKALENNKDLKIASLSVDEFYQNVIDAKRFFQN